jgi:hypothetical protein
MKGRGRRLLAGRGRNDRLRGYAARVLAVTVDSQSTYDSEENRAPKDARLLAAAMGSRLARTVDSRTGGTKNVLRPLSSLAVDFDFERESFSDSWALAVFRKCRYVDKDLKTTLNGRNESEAPIVNPLCERAIDAHMKGLT